MLGRMRNRFKFHLEQLIMRGAQYRLLVIAAAIGLVSLTAGILVMEIAGGFDEPGEVQVDRHFLKTVHPLERKDREKT